MVRDIYEATLPSANMFSICLLKYGEVRRRHDTLQEMYSQADKGTISNQNQFYAGTKQGEWQNLCPGGRGIFVWGGENFEVEKFLEPPPPPAIGEKF